MVLKMELFNVTLMTLVLFLLEQSNSQHLVPIQTGEYFETYTFKDKEYTLFSKDVSWTDANYVCELHNSTLAVPDDSDQGIFMAEAIANSEFSIENIWIGAHKVNESIKWLTGQEIPKTSNDIWDPSEPDHNVTYPTWLTEINLRKISNCVGLQRGNHNKPVLLILPCNVKRPFVCEKRLVVSLSVKNVDAIECDGNEYRIVEGKLKWEDASGYCAFHDMSLASIPDEECMEKIGNKMLRARPSIENAWVGADYDKGTWKWIETGLKISNESIMPSLLKEYLSNEQKGCLLIDKHGPKKSIFIETRCDRTRSFVCMKSGSRPYEIENNTFAGITTMLQSKLIWKRSIESCQRINGNITRFLNDDDAKEVLSISNGSFESVTHLWLPAIVNRSSVNPNLKWYDPIHQVYINKSDFTSIIWKDKDSPGDHLKKCLNLDPKTATVYELNCTTPQRTICIIGDRDNRNKQFDDSRNEDRFDYYDFLNEEDNGDLINRKSLLRKITIAESTEPSSDTTEATIRTIRANAVTETITNSSSNIKTQV